MKFWDASAVVLLLARQEKSAGMEALYGDDPAIVTWWGTAVECVSAIMRLGRAQFQTPTESLRSLERLRELRKAWEEIVPGDELRSSAERLLRVHPLRAADALQLAAALAACQHDPGQLTFVCADARLNEAARKEGFRVLE